MPSVLYWWYFMRLFGRKTGRWMLDAGSGYWILDTGYWMLDTWLNGYMLYGYMAKWVHG